MRPTFMRLAATDPLRVECARLRKMRRLATRQQVYSFLKDWQAALVGVIGFIGIGYTINGQIQADHLEQKAHERQEANHLRVALAAELESIADTNEGYAEDLRDGLDVVITLDRQESIYQSVIEKIGLLSQEEIRAVCDAYSQQRHFLPLIASTLTPTDVSGFYTVKADKFEKTARLFSVFTRSGSSAAKLLLTHIRLKR